MRPRGMTPATLQSWLEASERDPDRASLATTRQRASPSTWPESALHSHDGETDNSALGLGADRVGPFLQGMPGDDCRTRECRLVREQGCGGGRAHVPAAVQFAEVRAHHPRYDSERCAGRPVLLWRLSHAGGCARHVEYSGEMRVRHIRHARDQRLCSGRQMPRSDHRICLRYPPELTTEAPKGMVKVYPRNIDLENTARLKSFESTLVVETLEELRDGLDRRKREIAPSLPSPASGRG